MPNPCYVPGCKSGYRSSKDPEKRHFFSAPKNEDLRSLWDKNIRRIDRELTPKSVVCDLHFCEEDIVKADEFIIDGKPVIMAKGRWMLREGAIPVIFQTYPSYLRISNKKRRLPPEIRASPTVPSRKSKPTSLKEFVECEVDAEETELDETLLEAPLTFEDLIENCSMIALPSSAWGYHIVADADEPDSKCLCICEMSSVGVSTCTKTVVVKPDLTVAVWAGSNPCSNLEIDSPKRFADVGQIVSKLHDMCLCLGCSGFSDVFDCTSGQLINEIWHSKDCDIFLSDHEKQICSNCVQLNKQLSALRNRQQRNETLSLTKRNLSTLTKDQLITVVRIKNSDTKNLEKQVYRLSVNGLKKKFRIKSMTKDMLKLKSKIRKAHLTNKNILCELGKSQQKCKAIALKAKQNTGTILDNPVFTVIDSSSCHYEEVVSEVSK